MICSRRLEPSLKQKVRYGIIYSASTAYGVPPEIPKIFPLFISAPGNEVLSCSWFHTRFSTVWKDCSAPARGHSLFCTHPPSCEAQSCHSPEQHCLLRLLSPQSPHSPAQQIGSPDVDESLNQIHICPAHTQPRTWPSFLS